MKTALLRILILLAIASLDARAADDEMRGERVGWARLKTPSASWERHSRGDPVLMHFFRTYTTLNIDPTWYTADVENLDEMCKYPMLFSQGIHMVDSRRGQSNLAEYVRRGGFLLIDACINRDITPSPDRFLAQQAFLLSKILPEARVVELPRTHPIYRTFFQIPGGLPPHTYHDNIYDERWHKHGLHGIFIGERLAGLISLSGLQCGWDRMVAPPGHDEECMRMLVNIYIYAMLQGGGS